MTSLRLHIALALILVTGGVFFVLLQLFPTRDSLALGFLGVVLVAALFDRRYLFVGWYLMAPYFYPTPVEGELNVASNMSHLFFVPIIGMAILGEIIVQHKRLRFGKEEVFFFLFVGYATVSTIIFSKDMYNDIRGVYVLYLIPFILYTIIKNIQIDGHFIRALAFVSVFHVVVMTIMGIYEYRTGLSLYTSTLLYSDVGQGRIAGPFGSPIIMGVFVTFAYVFVYFASKLDHLPKIFNWAAGLFSGFLILLTFTRSVWAGAVVSAAYVMYKTTRSPVARFSRSVAFVGGVMIVISLLMTSSPEVANRVVDASNPSFRIVMAEVSVRMFLDNPIFGWGMGSFDEISERYLVDALGIYIVSDTSHVTLLTILVEFGIAGTLLFILFLYSTLYQRGMRWDDLSDDRRLLVIVSVSFIITFAINAFLIDMRFYTLAYSWFFVSLGFIQNVYKNHVAEWSETE